METTSYERDHHTSREPDQTNGELPAVGRESIRSTHSHEDRSMDLEAPLAQESRLLCYPPGGKEQRPRVASCPHRALPDLRWARSGSTFHGVTDGMVNSSSPCSSALPSTSLPIS